MSFERSSQMQDATDLIFNTANKLQTISHICYRLPTTAQPTTFYTTISECSAKLKPVKWWLVAALAKQQRTCNELFTQCVS